MTPLIHDAADRMPAGSHGAGIGPLSIRTTARGVARIDLGAPDEKVLGSTPAALAIAHRALDQLQEYLAGRRTRFQLPLDLDDLEGTTPFRRSVLDALRGIPYGTRVTYAELARMVGSGSPRAVGQAVGWNPVPIVIPCHRVIETGGGLGGYSGGLARKRMLLALEGC